MALRMTECWVKIGLAMEAFARLRARESSPLQYQTGLSNSSHENVAIRMFSRTFFLMPERIQKPVEPAPWGPKQGDGDGPRSPDISRPDTKDLLKKMRKVDPNQSKRYRQRTGQ
jgi:hypothetical protein